MHLPWPWGELHQCRHYAGLHHVLPDVLVLPSYQGTNLAMMQTPCSFTWSIRSMIVSLDLNKLSPNHSFAISSIYQLPVEDGRPITLPHCAQKQGLQTDLMIPDWKWHSLQHGTNLHSCMAGFWLSFEVQATSAYQALINSCQKNVQNSTRDHGDGKSHASGLENDYISIISIQ